MEGTKLEHFAKFRDENKTSKSLRMKKKTFVIVWGQKWYFILKKIDIVFKLLGIKPFSLF